MKLISMQMRSDENGDAFPETITVEMSIADALVLAEIYGQMNSAAHRISGATDGPYNCLVSSVFNRYWDAGVPGARAHFGGQPIDIRSWRERLLPA
jgi:hypothetical protein